MAESVIIPTKPRQAGGSAVARRLRREQQVPAILYGHKQAAVALAVSQDDVNRVLRHNIRVVELQVDGGNEQALIQEIQFDHLGQEVLHVDFKRVSRDERVVIDVRLELRGQAPGVTAGGALDQPMHTLEVECPVLNVPESIRVAIDKLQIGQMIHVRDIALPEGVKSMADPDAVVVLVKAPVVEAAVEAEASAAAAEPELIGRRPAEEEAEEEK
jgi:large subunit ribosomal protein L25